MFLNVLPNVIVQRELQAKLTKLDRLHSWMRVRLQVQFILCWTFSFLIIIF